MRLYQDEFPVASEEVSVQAGSTVTKDISGSAQTGDTVWKIGEWNGK